VSEEAEERLMRYFLLTHLCGISHRIERQQDVAQRVGQLAIRANLH